MLFVFTISLLLYYLEVIPRIFLFCWSFVRIHFFTTIFYWSRKKYGLIPRKNEIVHKIADGKIYREVEEELFFSLGNVKSLVFKIFRKIGIKNKVALIQIMKKYELKLYLILSISIVKNMEF